MNRAAFGVLTLTSNSTLSRASPTTWTFPLMTPGSPLKRSLMTTGQIFVQHRYSLMINSIEGWYYWHYHCLFTLNLVLCISLIRNIMIFLIYTGLISNLERFRMQPSCPVVLTRSYSREVVRRLSAPSNTWERWCLLLTKSVTGSLRSPLSSLTESRRTLWWRQRKPGWPRYLKFLFCGMSYTWEIKKISSILILNKL